MKHLTFDELKELEGKEVAISGWVQTIRDQGSIKFLIIRNTAGLFQAVVFKSSEAFKLAGDITHESVIELKGKVQLNKQAPEGVEIAADEIEILSLADPNLPIPVSGTEHNEAETQKRLD